jgi:hypothetical protein
VTAPAHRFPQDGEIRILIGRGRQEVEHSPVVPEIDLLPQVQLPRIRHKPPDGFTALPEALSRDLHCGIRDVDHRYAREALPQQMVDQS